MKFSTEAKWTTERKMELKTGNGIKLTAGPPPEFEGYKYVFTAEESFVGSINLCWINTLLAMKDKIGIEVRAVGCKAVGTVERPGKAYEFTKIELYPKIEISKDVNEDKLERLLDLSQRYCLVTQSIKSEIRIYPEIIRI